MVRAGLGQKTGKRMGHMSMSGEDGSIAAFADLDVARRVYVQLNNTNPVLCPDSAERAEAEAAGARRYPSVNDEPAGVLLVRQGRA